jgi:hypothetical protein
LGDFRYSLIILCFYLRTPTDQDSAVIVQIPMGYSEELTNIDHYVIQVDHNVVPVLTFDALPENKDLGFQAQPFGQFTFHNKAILLIMIVTTFLTIIKRR